MSGGKSSLVEKWEGGQKWREMKKLPRYIRSRVSKTLQLTDVGIRRGTDSMTINKL